MKPSKMELMHRNCPVCGEDKPKSIDHLKKITLDMKLVICENCGMIYHDPIPKQEDLIDYYINEYRAMVVFGNIITCNRKNEYHKRFIGHLIDGEKKLKVLDYGCAQGYLLKMLKDKGHTTEGIEHTRGFVNYAKYVYGLDVYDDVEKTSGDFDLVAYYHVLEHIPEADKELINIKKKMKSDALLYIAVPHYRELVPPMAPDMKATYDEFFPEEHLYYWTMDTLERMLNRVGYEVLKKDDLMYGITMLAKRNDDVKQKELKVDIDLIIHDQQKRKETYNLVKKGDFERAVEIYPRTPEAWIRLAYSKKESQDREKIFLDAIKADELSPLVRTQWGYEQMRMGKLKEGLGEMLFSFALRPADEGLMYQIGKCYGIMGEYEEAIKWMQKAGEINPQLGIQIESGTIADQPGIGWCVMQMR